MIRIAICDATLHGAEEIAEQLREFAAKRNRELNVETFRGLRQLGEQLQKRTFQLVILDPELGGGKTGLEFAKRMRQQGYKGELIFLARSGAHALEAYETYPLSYLVRPVSPRRLREVFGYLLSKLGKTPSVTLKLESGGTVVVRAEDIYYIEVFRTELDVHTRTTTLVCTGSLAGVLAELPDGEFYRSHRSYIVNLRYVTSVNRYSFVLDNQERVTVAKNRYVEAKEILSAYHT